MIPVSEIIPYENNPRKNDKAVDFVANSIKNFGFKVPLIIDKNNVIVTGHTRLKAAIKLGLKEVPVIWADDLTENQIKAFRIADNKTSEYSDWDLDLLKGEFESLDEKGIDLELTGFELKEIGDILDKQETKDDGFVEVDAYERAKNKSKVKMGDIYQLGEHRLMCGDSTNKEDVNKLMNGEKVDLLLTDPPYGVDYSGKNKFLNSIDKGNRIQKDIIGDTNTSEQTKLMWDKAFINSYEIMKDDASFYIFSADADLMMMMMMSINDSNLKLKQSLVWVKNNHVFGRRNYCAKHENILFGWKNKHNFYGGFQTSVWEFDKPLKNDLHPTMKPIELLIKPIKNSSETGNIILDLFGGSGTTLIACEQLNRKCLMMEIDPVYCQIIMDRWEKLTGKQAVKLN